METDWQTLRLLNLNSYHFVNGNSIIPPYPEGMEKAVFGMGCFWGPERLFWRTPGVYSTAVGYAGGTTDDPTYTEVCKDITGHTEVVLIVFDKEIINFEKLLEIFWESHNPTQGMRQRSDVGSQYRSAIYANSTKQLKLAEESLEVYQMKLDSARNDEKIQFESKILGKITTEIKMLDKFYFAEDYHQQYLAKNPNGYCSMKGTGVSCAI
ncbi:MAG: peptide-methionine (S)-S-oxide reductase [Woeseiaceae bacterium]|nr:peptide-methionine (S)-S-oxide reductase [Woeseiaceae bacterium]